MVCGKSNGNISFNQFYILGYFQLFITMFKLLVNIFIIRMYGGNTISKRIKKKHWQDMASLARSYEQLKTKYMKITANIVFIKTCKIEHLIPTCAKVNLSVKDDNKKLTGRIARVVIENQPQSKHREKKKLRKELTILNNQLETNLNIILYNTLIHQVNIAIKRRFKSVRLRHNKKLIKFRKSQQKYNKSTTQTELVRNIIHIFSSYALSHEELMPCHMD